MVKYALIALVVLATIAYMRNYNLRKQEERVQDPTITPQHFNIVQRMGLVVIFIWIALIGGVALFIGILKDPESNLLWVLVPLLMILGAIYCLASVYIWRIDVEGNTILYRNLFGRRTEYDITDISRVLAKSRNGIYGYRYVFYSDEKKLFTVDENTDNVYLLQRLEERGVHAEKR